MRINNTYKIYKFHEKLQYQPLAGKFLALNSLEQNLKFPVANIS
jgi:hypothetical protein